MIKFEKVSFNQFLRDFPIQLSSDEELIRKYYDKLNLPRRATPGSAGYDFFMPYDQIFTGDMEVLFPTGIRAIIPDNTFLMCVPRSGLGFKYGMRLVNTTGIIDASYAGAENEGHIMAKVSSERYFRLNRGDRFMQGIIVPYLITDDDDPIQSARTGGFGSTGGAA